MKYYSELTQKMYDTEEELFSAEQELNKGKKSGKSTKSSGAQPSPEELYALYVNELKKELKTINEQIEEQAAILERARRNHASELMKLLAKRDAAHEKFNSSIKSLAEKNEKTKEPIAEAADIAQILERILERWM